MAVAELIVRIVGDVREFQKTMSQTARSLTKLGKNIEGVGRTAMRLTAPIAAIGAVSVRSFALFDDAMTKSLAIMGDVSESMQKDMSNAAREVARQTTFSANEAADAYFFLASAGMNAEQSIAALPLVSKFAQAGAFDLAKATDLLTDAQSALGMVTGDVGQDMENLAKVSDVLVAANTLANASVEQFSTSLTNKAGTALKTLGKDLEEGVAALTIFADAGLKGEASGTALSTILTQLPVMAIKNKDAFQTLGIQVFDTEGKMRNLADIVRDYENATAGMSDEQQTAIDRSLGFNRQLQVGMRLLSGSSEALAENEQKLRDMGGITEEVAEKQLKSFSAQMSLVKSNLNDVAITIGERLAPTIGKIAKLISSFADRFREADERTQGLIIAIGTVAVVMGPLLIIIGKITLGFAALIKMFAVAKGAAMILASSTGIGAIAIAIGAVLVALWHFRDTIFSSFSQAYEITKEIFSRIGKVITSFIDIVLLAFGTSLEEIKQDLIKWGEIAIGVFNNFKDVVKFNIDLIVRSLQWMIGVAKSIFNTLFDVIISAFEKMERVAGVFSSNTQQALRQMRESLEALKAPIEVTTEKVEEVGVAVEELGETAKTTKEDLSVFSEEVEGLAGGLNTATSSAESLATGIGTAGEAASEAQANFDKLNKTVEKTGKDSKKAEKDVASLGGTLDKVLGSLGIETSDSISGIIGELTDGGGLGDLLGNIGESIFSSIKGNDGSITDGLLDQFTKLEDMFGEGSWDNIFGKEGINGIFEKVSGGDSFLGSLGEGGLGDLFGGEAGLGDIGTISNVIQGLSKIGKSTVETGKGIGGGLGAGIGAYFGGSAGAAIGEKIGNKLGGEIARGVKKIFGSGSTNPGTIARREFEKELNNLIDGKNIKFVDVEGNLRTIDEFNVGAKDRFNQAGWADDFNLLAGDMAGAFEGVAQGLVGLFGITENIAGQMAYVIFETVGGSLEGLGALINATGLQFEDLSAQIETAFQKGELSVREYVIQMNGLDEAFAHAEERANNLVLATQDFIATNGDSIESLRLFETVITAANNQGIKSITELVDHLSASGKFTEKELATLAQAFADHGIRSIDQLTQMGERGLSNLLAYITTLEIEGRGSFFRFGKEAEGVLDSVENKAQSAFVSIRDQIKNTSNQKLRIQTEVSGSSPSSSVVESSKGNAFNRGSVIPFAKGGIVSRKSFFQLGSIAEHAPEVIVPLKRMAGGEMGINAEGLGGKGDTTIINIDARYATKGTAELIDERLRDKFDRSNKKIGAMR